MNSLVKNGIQIVLFTSLILVVFFFQDDIRARFFTGDEATESIALEDSSLTDEEEVATSTQEIVVTEQIPIPAPVTESQAVPASPSSVSQPTPAYVEAKAQLEASIINVEKGIQECNSGTLVHEDCEYLSLILPDMKNCLKEQTYEGLEACQNKMIAKGFAGGYQSTSSTAPTKEPIPFDRDVTENELKSLISSGNFQNALAQGREEFRVCDDSSRAYDTDCLQGLYLLEGIDVSCPKTDDVAALNKCVVPVLNYVENKIEVYNESI